MLISATSKGFLATKSYRDETSSPFAAVRAIQADVCRSADTRLPQCSASVESDGSEVAGNIAMTKSTDHARASFGQCSCGDKREAIAQSFAMAIASPFAFGLTFYIKPNEGPRKPDTAPARPDTRCQRHCCRPGHFSGCRGSARCTLGRGGLAARRTPLLGQYRSAPASGTKESPARSRVFLGKHCLAVYQGLCIGPWFSTAVVIGAQLGPTPLGKSARKMDPP